MINSSTPLHSKLLLFLSFLAYMSLLLSNIPYIHLSLLQALYSSFFLISLSAILFSSLSSCLSDLRQTRLGPQHAPLHHARFLSIPRFWPPSSLNRRLCWGRDWGNGEGERGQLLVWVLHDSCCPVMKLGRSFKCLVCNGVSGTGLSFSPNSAFSAARRDPSLHDPPSPTHPLRRRSNCTLPRRGHTHTNRHTQRLPTAAGVSEQQKWPIFSPFHLNNKQGGVLKWAKGREKGNWADKGYCKSEETE